MNRAEERPDRERIQPPGVQTEVPPVEDEIDLFDYIEVIVRRRWLIFWGVVACTLASILYIAITPERKIYRAEATVLPEAQPNFSNLQAGLLGQQQSLVLDVSRLHRLNLWLAQTLANVLKSYSLNRKVLQKVYQYTLEGEVCTTNLVEYFGVKTQRQAIDALLGAAEFNADAETGLLIIAIETRSSELSAAVANEYIAQLILYRQEKRQAQFQQQLTVMEQRISEIQKESEQAQEALINHGKPPALPGDC